MAAQKTAPGSCGTVSASHQHRLDGNELYARAKADGVAPALQSLRYEESLVCYNRALRCASNDVERSSAHKNIALANLRLAQSAARQNSAYASEAGKDGRVDKVQVAELYRWEQALSSFEQARDCRVRCDDLGKWMESLIQMWWSCLEDLRQICLAHAYRQRLEFLQRLQTNVGQDKMVVWQMLQLFLCNIKFNESVRCREGDHFQSAIASAQSCLQDVNQLLDSCLRYGNKFSLFVGHCDLYDDDLHNLVEGLAARAEQQERICRAMQSCAVGDIVLDRALNANEDLGIELVWEAVDHFQQSLILARNQEVEQEAIAYARLTKVFARVLLCRDKAETYANRTATLAEALMPRNLHDEDWYRTAMAILEKIRFERRRVDEKAEAEELQQYKDQLKDELEALDELEKQSPKHGGKTATLQEVLVHIYTNHPPKNHPDYKLPDRIGGDDLKALCRKALLHYHPDKVKKDEDGMKWYVLCNEITKILNGRYAYVK